MSRICRRARPVSHAESKRSAKLDIARPETGRYHSEGRKPIYRNRHRRGAFGIPWLLMEDTVVDERLMA